MRAILSSLTVLAACAAAAAQTQNIAYHPDNVPSVGTANAFPFGATGCRIQQLIPQSALSAVPGLIQDLFIAPVIDTAGVYQESEIFYGDFEIQMGLTTATALTTTWAANSPNPTTVYRGPLRLRFLRDQWVPIGLPAPYLWLPTTPSDNLVIDFINWAVIDTGAIQTTPTGYYMNVRSGGIPRAYLRSWTATQPPTSQNVDNYGIKLGVLFNDGNFAVHGGGCVGSSTQAPWIGIAPGTWPQLGNLLDLRLAQGPPSLAANLVLGFNNRMLGGTVPLPLDLGPFGAPGCLAWHEVVAVSPLLGTDPTGAASFLTFIPNLPGLMSLRLFGTWLCFDPTANAIGLTTSGFGTIIIGS